MDHIVILGHFVILLVGTWALFLAHQTYRRFHLPFLKSLVHYIVAFNIAVFFYLMARYAMVNIFEQSFRVTDRSVALFLFPAALFVEFGLTFAVVRLISRLQGSENFKIMNRVFLVAACIFAISYFVGFMRLWSADSIQWLMNTTTVLGITAVVTIIGALVGLAIRKHVAWDPDRRKAVRVMAYLMLCGYLPYVALSFVPESYQPYGSVVHQLWLNIVPIIWLQYYFLPYYATLSTGDASTVMERLVREFNISQREREIMELIVAGKSNKEIEKQLFISVNTVKNHIYHLYKKLGIKSRSQLMHLVLNNNHQIN